MQIVHDLPNGFHEVKYEYIDELSVLFTDTFLEMNKIWAAANLDKEVLKSFFVQEIKAHLEAEDRVRKLYNDPGIRMNQVLIHGKRLVGATLHMELEEYKESAKDSKESEIPLFRELEREGKELIKAVDLDSFEKGKYVYASWGSQYRVPELKPAHKIHHIATIYDEMKSHGFKGMIFRSSNEKIIQFHTYLGGVVLKEVPFVIQGKEHKLWFVQEDFDNPQMVKAAKEATSALASL
jgi:hypothetical protein